MSGVTPRMAAAGVEPVEAPKGTRRSHMLVPKPRLRRSIIPSIDERALSLLASELGPDERKALRHIVETADVLDLGEHGTWLLAPATAALLDTLAAFEADGEDREYDLEDERDESYEDDSDSDNALEPSGRFNAPYDDEEPDGRPVEGETKTREYFAAQAERRARFRNGGGQRQVNNIKRMVRGDQPRWQEVEVVKYWGRAL